MTQPPNQPGTGPSAPPPRYSVVIPVYNEGANVGALCDALVQGLPPGHEVLICYDFDADDTLPALASLPDTRKPTGLRLVRNDLGRGVRYAIEAGMRAARAPVVFVVMADLSDELTGLQDMIASVEAGASVCCGSRYMPGGRQVGGPWLKGTLSRTAGLTLHWFCGVPTHDATNSFKAYSKQYLDQITIESTAGFCLGLELTLKAHFMGLKVTEVPCTWHDRTAGTSRFRLWAWMPKYLHWYFYAYRKRFLGWAGL